MPKLSIIIPVYNEKETLTKLLKRVEKTTLPGWQKEIILVDDYSTDGTRDILKNLESDYRVLYHSQNHGKGAALKTGFKEARGEIILIQDADLEYDPGDYAALLKPLIQNRTDVVYGSRNLKQNPRFRKRYYWGVKFISRLTNFLYGSSLTDVYTCYKAFRAPLLQGLDLRSNGFEFESEVTAKLLKKNFRIMEVPVNYYPRTFKQGKKIRWTDGIKAVKVLIQCKIRA